MSTIINTNIPALSAQRALMSNAGQLATSLQRLTSGLRINSSKDDAAGLAIAERLTTQVRGYNQAIRNAGDGISVAQTAEGGLDSITTSLQRMRELAVQAANFTNTDSDRLAIQQEAEQLKEEVQRVATQTKFNGLALLDGSFNGATFQVGANVGEVINVTGVPSNKTDAMGNLWVLTGLDVTNATGKTIAVPGATGSPFAVSGDTAIDLAASINAKGISGVFAFVSDGKLSVAYNGSAAGVTLNNFNATPSVILKDSTNAATNQKQLDDVNLSSVAGANWAIVSIDTALALVSGSRAKLGATMNRFEQTISNLRITAENQTASRSRIQDADFAQETAALTRAQILQQSGMAILAQANAVPQNVLALLR